MARVRGCGGSIIVGTGTTGVAGIREWSLDYTVNIIDGRGFDDACEPHPVLGMQTWEGSFRGAKDGAPLALFATSAINLKESTTTGQNWSGSALISGIHPTVTVDGLVEYSYDFVGIGTLTIATA
jgi:hypothetical protein